jgi:hypothetical protein
MDDTKVDLALDKFDLKNTEKNSIVCLLDDYLDFLIGEVKR